jgi:hypothetical protein
MSVIDPFRHALQTLGVASADDAATIKRAYRRAVLAHPPDTDAAAFRRVRDAYELLTDPLERATQMLLHEQPAIAPPVPADPPDLPPAGAACVSLLRLLAASIDWAALTDAAAREPHR